MNTPHNPYAPPRAALDSPTLVDHSQTACWRHNKIMIIEREGEFPPRCIKCNTEVDQAGIPVTVYWHHWAIYLLLIISAPIYVIVALIVRKSVKVRPFMCAAHRRKRNIGRVILYCTLLVFLGVFFASFNNMPALLAFAILLLLVGLVVGRFMSRTVYAQKIDDHYLQLKGCDASFLDSLPEFGER